MVGNDVFLAVLKPAGRTWLLVRGTDDEIAITDDTEVWGIVTSIVRQAI
jgi:hypothetical protein